MDHRYSQKNFDEDVSDICQIYEEHVGEIDTENVNMSVPEKVGDNYLIELYRERRFLYDKSHRDFKDNELKNNAWKEISSIMKDKNLGNVYTAEYCKKRMINLREQYVKLKKEQDFKSGSAASIKKKSALLSELSFLDMYIQRRRTLTNMNENMPTCSFNKKVAECPEPNIAESINLHKRNYEEVFSNQDIEEDDLTKNLCDQMPSKIFKKNATSKQNIENDDVLRDLTKAAINIAANVGSTSVEHAFAEFITLSLEKMEEPKRNIRRNKIFYDLTTPLERLQSNMSCHHNHYFRRNVLLPHYLICCQDHC